MTHKDIFTKFMIEYDKANITSSYPSLTEYEIATVLDKAYLTLIALKVTGNNIRRAPFEADVKSVTDLQPLVVTRTLLGLDSCQDIATNVFKTELPNNFLYFVKAYSVYNLRSNPMDDYPQRAVNVRLVTHEIASKFFSTTSNLPWVKEPVCYIENNEVYVVMDPINTAEDFNITYIKIPNKFVKDFTLSEFAGKLGYSYLDYGKNTSLIPLYTFELNDVIAEELISLAISYALENVESPRLNAHLGMRGLES